MKGTRKRHTTWVTLAVAAAAWAAAVALPSNAQLPSGLADKAKEALSRKNEKPDDKASGDAKSTLQPYTGPKKRLAVMDMEVKVTAATTTEPSTTGGATTTTTVSIPPPADFGTGLTEMLTTALVATGRFVVLERKYLTDIQFEQQLGASGAVEPESAPKAGKLLGAQAMVRGAVTEYTYRRSSTSGDASFLKGVGIATSKAQAAVVLDVRLYDAVTSQVIDSVKAEGRAKSSATAINVDKADYKMSASGFSSSPLGQATRQAIERAVAFIVQRMEEIPWEGRIAEVEAEEGSPTVTLYINAGSKLGLKEGNRLEVLRPGRAIVDPETRLVIGRTKDKRLGSCRIESLTSDLATAVPEEGDGFQVGDVVRLITAPKAKGQEKRS